MNKVSLIKAVTVGLLATASVLATQSAKAFTLTTDGTDFTEIETVGAGGAGVYGLEARGGNNKLNGTWEIGVGSRTSSPGNFNEAQFTWGAGAAPRSNFQLSWLPGVGLSANIGGESVSWNDATWQAGNAIKIVTKRQAILNITALDGQAFVQNLGTADDSFGQYYIKGDSLLDGWTLNGQIGVTGGRNSRNEVLIKAGNFAQSVPEPTTVLPAIIGLGLAAVRKRRMGDRASQDA